MSYRCTRSSTYYEYYSIESAVGRWHAVACTVPRRADSREANATCPHTRNTYSQYPYVMKSVLALALVVADAPSLVYSCGFATFADLPGIEEVCECWELGVLPAATCWACLRQRLAI